VNHALQEELMSMPFIGITESYVKSYIGITGFTSRLQVRKVLSAMPKQSNHLLMVGVLVSQKTLAGGTNKYPMRYPKIGSVAGIFPHDPRVLNLVHYCTDEKKNLAAQLEAVLEHAGPNCHGFQLNVAWPDRNEIKKFLDKFPLQKIVLQIGRHALEKMSDNPRQVADKLHEYHAVADYFLLDGSGGKGIPLDPDKSITFLTRLIEGRTGIKPGLAGGLGPDSLDLLNPVLKHFPDLSIDAEGQLRNARTDVMSTRKTKKYLIRSLGMVKKV